MYRPAHLPVCRLPTIGWYRRLGLFPPRYHPKLVGNGQFRPSMIGFERYQPREKEEEGEEKGEPGDPAFLSRSQSVARGLLGASRGESSAIAGRRKRRTTHDVLSEAS
ncbi:hypothetical protein BHM03_00055505 [Ensete ventricosum]|nr:hypothetical protein BHM03_00055505 [Ensete ventricosum]